MSFKDKILSLFSRAPSKNGKSDGDYVFLVDKIPPEGFPLRKRKIGGCAHYSLKAVIEGKKEKIKKIEDYSADWWSRSTYLMTPWGLKEVLKRYKLNYKIINAGKLNDNEKLFLLKQNLKDGPIILLIANGQTKKRWFSLSKALFHRHYITLWGYNDSKKFFYVYDSNTRRKTENEVLNGILKVPYKYVLKEWGIGASRIIHDYAIAIKY